MASSGAAVKRPRLEEAGPAEEAVVLQPAQLDKFKPNRNAAPSPGAIAAGRIAARVSGAAVEAYFADDGNVYRISVPLQAQVEAEAGKEGVLIPTAAQPAATSLVHSVTSTDGEIQTLTLLTSEPDTPDWLGSVDCYGRVNIQQLPPSTPGHSASAACSLQLDPPPGLGNREAGWVGLALSRQPAASGSAAVLAATTLRLSKTAAAYQDGRLLRSFHTLGHPTAVTWVPGLSSSPGDVLAVAEESRVTLWDVRQGERGGLLQQLSLSPAGESIFSLAWVPTGAQGLLASAGEERAVVLTEPRKWTMVHKWAAAVKYTIHYMAFSHVNPRYCYVSGLDYECVCGRWDRASSGSAGNANSAPGGGHGRAVGPKGMPGIGGRHGQRPAAPVETPDAPVAADPEKAVAATDAAAASTEDAEAVAKAHPATRRPNSLGITFRSDSRWLGMACADGSRWLGRPCDVVATYSQSGHVYVLQTRGSQATGVRGEGEA